MKPELLSVIPVLPTANLERDVAWYEEHTGFKTMYAANGYAVLRRGNIGIHLQWHADTPEDPLLGGSVARFSVKNLKILFEEFIERGTVTKEKWLANTPWQTNEFGFYDLNNNALIFLEDLMEE